MPRRTPVDVADKERYVLRLPGLRYASGPWSVGPLEGALRWGSLQRVRLWCARLLWRDPPRARSWLRGAWVHDLRFGNNYHPHPPAGSCSPSAPS